MTVANSTTSNRGWTVSMAVGSALLTAGMATVFTQDSRAEDFTQRLYINGGIGVTQVEPESPSDALTISDKNDSGGHLGLGYDLSRMFSVEAYVADLGTAEVEFLGAEAGSIDYQVYGVSLLGYLYNSRSGSAIGDSDTNGLFRREGLSLYGRAGIGHMLNDANGVEYTRDYPNHAAFGLGLEYGFENGFALRSEIMSMDTDAKYFNVGVLKRFGGVPVVVPVPVAEPKVVVAEVAEIDQPESPVIYNPVTPPLVYFEFDKSEINQEDQQKLDAFASAVQDSDSDVKISIEGHTDWIAAEQYNMSLSIRRAEAVFNYLVNKGLPAESMTTIGYGEMRPVSNNNTANGRALNRRTEIQLR